MAKKFNYTKFIKPLAIEFLQKLILTYELNLKETEILQKIDSNGMYQSYTIYEICRGFDGYGDICDSYHVGVIDYARMHGLSVDFRNTLLSIRETDKVLFNKINKAMKNVYKVETGQFGGVYVNILQNVELADLYKALEKLEDIK